MKNANQLYEKRKDKEERNDFARGRRLYACIASTGDDSNRSQESYQASENGLIYRPLSQTFAKADAEARKRIPGKECA